MVQWEYAFFCDASSGVDGIRFTRGQGQQLVPFAKQALDRGLHEKDSTEHHLHLNMRNTNAVAVVGLLGRLAWELVLGTPTASSGSDRVWVFKRPVQG